MVGGRRPQRERRTRTASREGRCSHDDAVEARNAAALFARQADRGQNARALLALPGLSPRTSLMDNTRARVQIANVRPRVAHSDLTSRAPNTPTHWARELTALTGPIASFFFPTSPERGSAQN